MDEALDKAVRVFCERGFHATTIADLTSAMELASGSVYKAFDDKRAVFLAAFERYKSVRDGRLREILSEAPSGRARVRAALTFYAEASQGAEGKRGCLVTAAAAELATFDPEVAARVTQAVGRNEALMKDLIRQGQADGSISAHIEAEATAGMMLCVVQGMRIVGKTGRSGAEMLAVVDVAMRVLG